MFVRMIILSCLMSAALITGCATTPTVDSGTVAIENKDMSAVIVFNDSDRGKISDYYKSMKKTKTMPPGLAKKQELPPGQQKHIARYGELPPGLEGRRLPLDLEEGLSRLPAGYVRLRVGGDVVLMNEKTRVVLDVIWDVSGEN